MLDVSGPPERTGKPRGTDLLDGTVTLPLILARERDPELRALDLRAAVTDAGRGGGGVRPDRARPARSTRRARQALTLRGRGEGARWATLELPRSASEALDLVADGVVERYACGADA